MPLFALGILWLVLAGAILATQLTGAPKIEIEWVTETEFETVGFNLYRSDAPGGGYVQINDQLISGRGDPASGASYSYVDRAVAAGKTYYYRLEEVEFDNSRQPYDIGPGEEPFIELWAVVLATVAIGAGCFLLVTAFRQE